MFAISPATIDELTSICSKLSALGFPEAKISPESDAVLINYVDFRGHGGHRIRVLEFSDITCDVEENDRWGLFQWHQDGSVISPIASAATWEEIVDDFVQVKKG